MSIIKNPIRVLAFGAHPDDCDICAGGLAILYSQKGHSVKFVSVTNGDAGHHKTKGEKLAKRRAKEAKRAGKIAGIEYITLHNYDGLLEPTLKNRKELIRMIRKFKPNLILTHRPNDYHPDHRYTSILIQDSAYMVTVPAICPDTPHLSYNPVIAYFSDDFQKPIPFQPTIAIGIDSVLSKKFNMLHCHQSQFYEWLPYNQGYEKEIPKSDSTRRKWLESKYKPEFKADPYRNLLIKLYGEKKGKSINYAEAFEACEYGSKLNDRLIRELFPFFDESQLY